MTPATPPFPPRRRNSRWLPPPDAVHFELRRQALDMVLEIARRDHHTPSSLAHTLNITRPRAWLLLDGQQRHFNTETLVDILARLGVSVELTVTEVRPYVRYYFRNPRPGWRPMPGAVTG